VEQLEVMAAKVARSAAQAEALIEALLTLAASEQAPASPELVDLAAAEEDAAEAAAARARGRGRRVENGRAARPAAGDPRPRGAGEGAEWGRRGGGGQSWGGGGVPTPRGAGGRGAGFETANGGRVTRGGLVPPLFEPFRRVEERTSDRDGAGLGLAIVRSIGT